MLNSRIAINRILPSYDFIYSDEQAAETAKQPQFYQDRLTA